jgi:hypothetical protein
LFQPYEPLLPYSLDTLETDIVRLIAPPSIGDIASDSRLDWTRETLS